MKTLVHPTAVVADDAKIADGVEIGPYAVIGPNVTLGAGTRVLAHAVIEGYTVLGARCIVYPGASLGFEPQDKKFDRHSVTWVKIGDDNVFREGVTVHRAATPGGATEIGDRCYFMATSHVGHDSRVANDVTLANSAALGGHSIVEDKVVIGGLTGVHQFCRIGKFAMVGGCSKVASDIPPFSLCNGNPAVLYGPNSVGLKRAGYGVKSVMRLRRALHDLLGSGASLGPAIERVRAASEGDPEVEYLLRFCESSKRGLARGLQEVHS